MVKSTELKEKKWLVGNCFFRRYTWKIALQKPTSPTIWCYGLFQIHFLDINKTVGEETQKSFNNQHGAGQAKFVCCDITSHEKLEGRYLVNMIYLVPRLFRAPCQFAS